MNHPTAASCGVSNPPPPLSPLLLLIPNHCKQWGIRMKINRERGWMMNASITEGTDCGNP
ncbi:MAG: hypothetical protein QF682_08495 [Candidatus Thermoplasmatota archaeon]|nr:hypothetical protein [Candidatus Thermoplasmatota archaeon]